MLLGLERMGLLKKIFALSIILIAIVAIIAYTNHWNLEAKPVNLGLTEEAIVRKVSFDAANNTLLLDVQSMCSRTIVFNTAVIKDSDYRTVATIVSLRTDIPADKNKPIMLDISNIYLNAGNFTVSLWTTNSHVFTSPSFTVR